MNKEFKQNILRIIKNNRVVTEEYSDTHYVYNLYGYKNILLMRVEFFDGILPRITIEINGEHVAHINHFAQTSKQIKNNYDVLHIANKMFDKAAEQNGLVKTTMNRKQFMWTCFLNEHSLKRH